MIEKLDHIVITTPEPRRCLDFYKKLGFEIKDSAGHYEMFAGDFKINVHVKGSELSPHAQNVQPGSGDFCFAVSGKLEDFKKMLEANSIPIELGIVGRTGAHGPMQSIYLRDPEGNLLEFSSYSN